MTEAEQLKKELEAMDKELRKMLKKIEQLNVVEIAQLEQADFIVYKLRIIEARALLLNSSAISKSSVIEMLESGDEIIEKLKEKTNFDSNYWKN